ncbi:MAG: hypothetical protein QW341_04440 [Candidatus Bathyarchaeia archaeon]
MAAAENNSSIFELRLALTAALIGLTGAASAYAMRKLKLATKHINA